MNDEPNAPEARRQVPVLGNNLNDRLASAVRSSAGAVPYVGSLISEVVTNFIPNQRLDRIESYLAYLTEELAALNISDLENKLCDPENVALLEDGGFQAARAVSDGRRRYLARAVAVGISNTEISKIESRRLLQLVSELDDQEVLILTAYASGEWNEQIRPKRPLVSASNDEHRRWALYEASIEKLLRLGVLSFRHRIDGDTGIPKYDTFGVPEGSRNITTLGRLVLSAIGIQPKDRSLRVRMGRVEPVTGST
jgi:hypothetical protein